MTATTLHSLHYTTTTTPLRYNYNYSCSTSHYIQQLWVRWPLQPLQPLQQTQLQPLFGPSVDSLCHPWFTTTNVSYRFPILKLPPPPCAVLLVIYRRLRRIHLKIGRTVYITMLTSRRNGRTVYHWVFNTALALIPPTRDMCKPKVPGPWLLIEYIKFRGRHLESWVMFDQVFPRLTSLKQHGLVHQDRLTQLRRSFPHMVTSANRRFQARGFHARFWENISSCQFPL